MKIAGSIWLCLAVLVLPAAAFAEPSVERGRELFKGTQLGTNGKSCADCHPGGRGLAAAAGYGDERLAKIINQCISKPLGGIPLGLDSSDMKSMVIYLRTFAGPEGK